MPKTWRWVGPVDRIVLCDVREYGCLNAPGTRATGRRKRRADLHAPSHGDTT